MSLNERLETILKRAAESENITNYEVFPHLDSIRGDGFLSQFFTGDIKNKDTGELIQIYIKMPPNYEIGINSVVFNNEYSYYAKIFPELLQFEREKKLENLFDKIPKFYCGSLEEGNEYVALENLKVQGYVLHDKTKFLDESLLNFIFETYGHYHALTFAFKDEKSERFEELTALLQEFFKNSDKKPPNIKEIFNIGYNNIKLTDEESARKIKALIDDFQNVLLKKTSYQGKYSTLVHGDCWSNNMLFKYNSKGELENLRLLDHQLAKVSTPVHDLSYFFYSGASKKDFDNLEHYLQIYYKSFKKHCQELGTDPEKLFPFEALMSDWKLYGLQGVIMGLMVWQAKLMPKDDIVKLTGKQEKIDMLQVFQENIKKLHDNPVFVKNISDILLHAVEYGLI